MGGHDPAVVAKIVQWLAHADEDLRFAAHGFGVVGGNPYALIAYHAQQSAEKHLKAYLVLKGVDFPFTHNLARLLELCAAHARWPADLKDAEELSPFAVSARYPGEFEEVTEPEARHAVEIARRVRETVRRALSYEGLTL